MRFYKRFVIIYGFLLISLAGSLILVSSNQARADANSPDNYPKLANFYLGSPITRQVAEELAKWNVVVLSALNQTRFADEIRYIRKVNPKIIILAYIPSEDFPISHYSEWDQDPVNGLYNKLLKGINDEMWLRDENGQHVEFWSGYWMLNASNYSTNHQRWNEYLSDFVTKEILSTGLWDGIFYDNVWTGISWINGGKIDINRDGRNDAASAIDSAWNDGMSALFKLTRQKAGKNIILIGNGDRGFYGDLNGLYHEYFTADPSRPWSERMRWYSLSAVSSLNPAVTIVGNNSVSANGQTDYRAVRYGLASALMSNGYYGYDAGVYSHAERWWYDEYNVTLGKPAGEAVSLTGKVEWQTDVWRREYSGGLALVNSTNISQEVDLGGEYEKIIGQQDPVVNNGSIVTKVALSPQDGLVMLKTLRTIKKTVFTNGAFLRFYTQKGERARNGFFAFEEGWPGGTQIYTGDLNNDGTEEKIVGSGSRLQIFNGLGEHWYNDYPFGSAGNEEIRLAVAPLVAGEKPAVAIASSNRGKVVVLNYHGVTLINNLYPLGKKYKSGFTIDLVNMGLDQSAQLVLGTGRGVPAKVLIFDLEHKKVMKQFFPFEKNYTGGVNVASGDFNGDGKIELAVASGYNKKPLIRFFDLTGKKLSEFALSGIFSSKPVTLSAVLAADGHRSDLVVNSGN